MKSNNPAPRKAAVKKSKPATAATKETKSSKPGRTVAKAKKDESPAPAPKTKTKGVPKKKALTIPPLLLEGDMTVAPPVSGPGQRYALGPTPPTEHFTLTEGDLPEAYGTKQLFLTARDPHWLYAHWDLNREQLQKYNSGSIDHHLVLRIYRDAISGEPLSQIHLHPESRNWFVPVAHAGAKYLAQLGYYDSKSRWKTISSSAATLTPPDTLAEETAVRFATIPADVPFEQLLALVKTALRENVPLVEALEQLRASGYTQLPGPREIAIGKWTPAQEHALASVVMMDQIRRVWIGSLEITELIRRQLQQDISSISVAQLGWPTSPMGASISSAFGGMEKGKGFWFNVNAELIIYGATEPDATVTIGAKKIKLRPDGTFSFRFALPDGNYNLPAMATSVDGDDSRSADLKFSRNTAYNGEVAAHPQDARLKKPEVANVA